jgi:hypothetical protein
MLSIPRVGNSSDEMTVYSLHIIKLENITVLEKSLVAALKSRQGYYHVIPIVLVVSLINILCARTYYGSYKRVAQKQENRCSNYVGYIEWLK